MLNSVPVSLLVSALLGILTGLGIGGGSLLILWLTAVLSVDPAIAGSVNLLFFIPSALISCLIHWKQGKISWFHVRPAVLWGCVSAAAVSVLSRNFSTALLRKGYGILLLVIGIRELFYRPRKAR